MGSVAYQPVFKLGFIYPNWCEADFVRQQQEHRCPFDRLVCLKIDGFTGSMPFHRETRRFVQKVAWVWLQIKEPVLPW